MDFISSLVGNASVPPADEVTIISISLSVTRGVFFAVCMFCTLGCILSIAFLGFNFYFRHLKWVASNWLCDSLRYAVCKAESSSWIRKRMQNVQVVLQHLISNYKTANIMTTILQLSKTRIHQFHRTVIANYRSTQTLAEASIGIFLLLSQLLPFLLSLLNFHRCLCLELHRFVLNQKVIF